MSAKSSRAAAAAEPAAQEITAGQYETLFYEHWPRVYGLLVRLVGDQDEAEDLALEAFIRLREEPAAGGLNVGGWLRRVATNLGLNAIRGWKRRQLYEQGAAVTPSFENHSPAPTELFAREEARQQVRAVLGAMNPRQARLLILRYSGLPYREIAADLGVSAASVGPLLARAEEEFEKRFRAAYPEGS